MDTPTQLLNLADEVTCFQYSGCERDVIECVFQGGHICNRRWQFEHIIDFMLKDLIDTSSVSGGSIMTYVLLPLGIVLVCSAVLVMYPRIRQRRNVFTRLRETEIAPISG